MLAFLQSGEKTGPKFDLRARSLLWQLFLRPLTSMSLVHISWLCHLGPLYHFESCLVRLTNIPFRNIQDIPLATLTQKVAFVVAITPACQVSAALSCKQSFFVLHNDKVGLCPRLTILSPQCPAFLVSRAFSSERRGSPMSGRCEGF